MIFSTHMWKVSINIKDTRKNVNIATKTKLQGKNNSKNSWKYLLAFVGIKRY